MTIFTKIITTADGIRVFIMGWVGVTVTIPGTIPGTTAVGTIPGITADGMIPGYMVTVDLTDGTIHGITTAGTVPGTPDMVDTMVAIMVVTMVAVTLMGFLTAITAV